MNHAVTVPASITKHFWSALTLNPVLPLFASPSKAKREKIELFL
jgi:hypothetical protein